MSDDDRQRRRMGDATKDRIADLADGWSLPGQAPETTGRAPTDPAEVVTTTPFDKAEEVEDDAIEEVQPARMATDALEVLRADAQRRSDSEIQRNLTPLRAMREEDATTIDPPSGFAQPIRGAHLRDVPTLPRSKGFGGDLAYVWTVVRGVRRAKKELLEVEDTITTLKSDRASRLADLGRAAISDDRFDQTAVRASRDLLGDIEDRRSRHAGAAAAADAELDAVDRARQSQMNKLADEVGGAEADVTRLDGEIAPLERQSAAARRRAAQVKDTLATIDSKIAAARASLVSVKGPTRDAAAVEAELASLRADREAVSRDEPTLAAELDALLPRIASLEAQRADAQERIDAARAAEKDARTRTDEHVAAISARRRVESRAAAEAKTASERALIELGERLYVERPDDLTVKLGAVDKQDVSIATAQRKAIELRELIGSVDKAALARGIAYWVLIVAALTTLVWILL